MAAAGRRRCAGVGPEVVRPEPWGRLRRPDGGKWWSVGGRPRGKDDEDLSALGTLGCRRYGGGVKIYVLLAERVPRTPTTAR